VRAWWSKRAASFIDSGAILIGVMISCYDS
jgi:hypothetical protein